MSQVGSEVAEVPDHGRAPRTLGREVREGTSGDIPRGRVRALAHAGVIAALFLLAALIVLPPFGFPPTIPPFAPDNIDALSLGAFNDPWFFFSHGGAVWRPLTYSTLWGQYELGGLDISAFVSFNVLLWVACASLVYATVYFHTRLILAAAPAALVMLTDDRSFTALVWFIERQSLLASIFGLLALLSAHRLIRQSQPSRGTLAVLLLLLLAAATSKEFGLAFAFGVVTIGLLHPSRRRELVGVGVGALVVYGLARGLAGGLNFGSGAENNRGFNDAESDLGLCEVMGWGANPREVCYGKLGLVEQLGQYAWNIGASFVGIFIGPLLDTSGYLLAPDFLGSALGGPDWYAGFAVRDLIVPMIVTALAVVAFWKRPRVALPLLAIIAANALLDLQYYRPRNVVVGMVALHVAAGIGIPPTFAIIKRYLRRFEGRPPLWPAITRRGRALAAIACVLGLAAILMSQAGDLSEQLDGAYTGYAERDPCDAAEEYGSEMPNLLKEKYGLPGRCQYYPAPY